MSVFARIRRGFRNLELANAFQQRTRQVIHNTPRANIPCDLLWNKQLQGRLCYCQHNPQDLLVTKYENLYTHKKQPLKQPNTNL